MPDRTIALIGAGLLFIGAFLPIVSMPVVGSVNYFQNGRGDGVIILLLAAATAILAGTRNTRHVLWTGIAALALLGYTFVRLQLAIADMRARLETELADNPFRGLAEAAVGAVQIQWGWAVLTMAAGMVIWAGWSARKSGIRRS
jgi:hypothetical protein